MSVRLISRLDVKQSQLIKGIQMEGWRKYGDPAERSQSYYFQGVDELLFMDVVASLYQRNTMSDVVRRVASEVFIPITVGGGVHDLASAKQLLDVGADKVAINTAATKNPNLIEQLSDVYGSQAVVLSIEAKRLGSGNWEAMTDNGRNHTDLDVVKWAVEGARRGAGEILITSVDQDGTLKGYDNELIASVSKVVDVPVIASGGAGHSKHVQEAVNVGANAVALGRALHTGSMSIPRLRADLMEANVPVRVFQQEMYIQ